MSTPFANNFNYIRFFEFLKQNNILTTAIAAVLSYRINDITNELFDGLVMPIINRDANKDGIPDVKKFEDYEIEVLAIKFKVGKMIMAVVKLLIILYIVYIVAVLMHASSNLDLLALNSKNRTIML